MLHYKIKKYHGFSTRLHKTKQRNNSNSPLSSPHRKLLNLAQACSTNIKQSVIMTPIEAHLQVEYQAVLHGILTATTTVQKAIEE